MGTVVSFPKSGPVAIQLSANPQDDGSIFYTVEALNADDTWDIIDSSKDRSAGWLKAERAAESLGVPLLPTSTFPGRAA